MLTTIVDHNDIRLGAMESDSGKPYSQVSDSSRQSAGSLQASGTPASPSSGSRSATVTTFLLRQFGDWWPNPGRYLKSGQAGEKNVLFLKQLIEAEKYRAVIDGATRLCRNLRVRPFPCIPGNNRRGSNHYD